MIFKGIAKIRSNETKILHIINLEQIQDALNILQLHTEKDIQYNNLYHTIQHEIAQTFVFSSPERVEQLIFWALFGNL